MQNKMSAFAPGTPILPYAAKSKRSGNNHYSKIAVVLLLLMLAHRERTHNDYEYNQNQT